MVETLVFPLFDYAGAMYHDLNTTQELRVKILVNSCVRFVHGTIPWRSHVTPYRLQRDWLSPRSHRELYVGSLAFTTLPLPPLHQ